jgi:hypothetical protein
MGAAYEIAPSPSNAERVFEAFLRTDSHQTPSVLNQRTRAGAVTHPHKPDGKRAPPKQDLRQVQERADIDISGPEFNFVRSIRVFHVRYVRQNESESTGDCDRRELVVLGTYGVQGEFSWQTSSVAGLPPAHFGLARYGEHCPDINHRSVFVDWRDYAGRYGFEQVNY